MKFTAAVFFLLGCIALGHCKIYHVTGSFGNQTIHFDFEFVNGLVIVTVHKPDNAPEHFRETTNLHDFVRGVVVLRDSGDRKCYIRHFNETLDEMRGRIENAESNNNHIGDVTERRLNLNGIEPLSPRTVKELLGRSIAKFCKGHVVFFIGEMDYTLLDPEANYPQQRGRRSVQVVIVNAC